jgi:Spy/CpxP family protein refolding chaperone
MRSWFATVAAAVLLAANWASAQEQNATNAPPRPMRERIAARMPGGLLPPRIADDLSLTDEQKTKLKDIEAAFVKELDAWRAAHKDVETDLQKLREEAGAARKAGDNAKLEETRKKMQDMSAPMMDLRRKYMDQIRATLTDEQKKKLEDALQQMMQHRGGPPGGGGAPPPPPDGGAGK